jgi:NADPH:quinone reductase-like Zn-dependent oxidoreductase
MKAIRLHAFRGLEGIRAEEIEAPRPGPGEVLLRVEAAGVNPVDWKIANGDLQASLRHELPITLGCDASGVVEAVDEGVEDLEVGDAVFGYLDLGRCGAFASHALARAEELAPKPESVSHAEAAAVPVAALTSWQAMVEAAGLREGRRVLVHAAAGGVGSIAVQMAKALGATVVGTASGENEDFVRSLGADAFIDYRTTPFEDAAREIDVVFDTVGGDTQERSFKVLKAGGFLVSIVTPPSETLAHDLGVTTAMIAVHPDGARLRELAMLMEEGRMRATVAQAYPLDEALAALRRSREGHTRGKLVLLPA